MEALGSGLRLLGRALPVSEYRFGAGPGVSRGDGSEGRLARDRSRRKLERLERQIAVNPPIRAPSAAPATPACSLGTAAAPTAIPASTETRWISIHLPTARAFNSTFTYSFPENPVQKNQQAQLPGSGPDTGPGRFRPHLPAARYRSDLPPPPGGASERTGKRTNRKPQHSSQVKNKLCSWSAFLSLLVLKGDETPTQNLHVRIVLVGKPGVGKSAVGNTILGTEEFTSPTSSTQIKGHLEGDTHMDVIDTPGSLLTNLSDEATMEILKCVWLASLGPHVFLVVINSENFTEDDKQTVTLIQEIFGERASDYTMVLFTHGDKLMGRSSEDFIERNDVAELLEQCHNRYHVFDNRDLKTRSQVKEMLQKIKRIVDSRQSPQLSRLG
ncbi:GIMA7 GTPase, partial [Atractosteus spatula]|nr:GIMA7 GTPase [Atractosteus spatula]